MISTHNNPTVHSTSERTQTRGQTRKNEATSSLHPQGKSPESFRTAILDFLTNKVNGNWSLYDRAEVVTALFHQLNKERNKNEEYSSLLDQKVLALEDQKEALETQITKLQETIDRMEREISEINENSLLLTPDDTEEDVLFEQVYKAEEDTSYQEKIPALSGKDQTVLKLRVQLEAACKEKEILMQQLKKQESIDQEKLKTQADAIDHLSQMVLALESRERQRIEEIFEMNKKLLETELQLQQQLKAQSAIAFIGSPIVDATPSSPRLEDLSFLEINEAKIQELELAKKELQEENRRLNELNKTLNASCVDKSMFNSMFNRSYAFDKSEDKVKGQKMIAAHIASFNRFHLKATAVVAIFSFLLFGPFASFVGPVTYYSFGQLWNFFQRRSIEKKIEQLLQEDPDLIYSEAAEFVLDQIKGA